MYRRTKYELNKMLNGIPTDHDTIITITRTGGDCLTFYQYERYKIRLFDDHLLYYKTEDNPIRILYQNIIRISWQPVFKDKHMTMVVEAEYEPKNNWRVNE